MIGVVVHGLVFVLLGGATANTTGVDGDYGASFNAGLDAVGTLVLSIVSFVFGIFVQAAFLSGGLDLADGRPVTVGSFFKPRNFGTVVLAGALLSVISAVLDLLSLLPAFCSRSCHPWRSPSSRFSRCSRSRLRQIAGWRRSMR